MHSQMMHISNRRWIRFLIRHTHIPLTGPKAKVAIRAGNSDKSIFIKLGIIGIEKSRNIRMKAIAESIPVTAINLTRDTPSFLFD